MTRPPRPEPLKTTVTFLEMTAPSKVHCPLPVNVQAAVMRAQTIPLHFYRYLQYRTGLPWHWVYRLRLDDDALSLIVHDPATSVHVLYIDGAPAGFFEIRRENEATADLAYFGLMGHVHGHGFGKWFLSQAIAAAWEQGPSRVTVNTNTLDHHIALPLYQRMGFKPVGQSETFVRPLTDDDLLRLAHFE